VSDGTDRTADTSGRGTTRTRRRRSDRRTSDGRERERRESDGKSVFGPETRALDDRTSRELRTDRAGRPLPASVRSDFEPAFGRTLGGVRVHADARAAGLARRLDASAFAYGRDVYFGAGAYDPDSTSGRRLIAHELAHTVQQRNRVDGAEPTVVDAPAAEREASAAARQSGPAPVTTTPVPGPVVQRQQQEGGRAERSALRPGQNFEVIGTETNAVILVRTQWLLDRGVPLGTTSLTGAEYPEVIRPILDELLRFYSWASPERAYAGMSEIQLEIPGGGWEQDVMRVPLKLSFFSLIGLPPGRAIRTFFTGGGVTVLLDLTQYGAPGGEQGGVGGTERGTAIAEDVADALASEVGAPMRPEVRPRFVEMGAQSVAGATGVGGREFNQEQLAFLFGERAARRYVASQLESASPTATTDSGGIVFPPSLDEDDRQRARELLLEIFGPTEPREEREQERPTLRLSHTDVEALLAIDEDPNREAILAELRGRGGRPVAETVSLANRIEVARERIEWREAGGREFTDDPDDPRPPIVYRPVHGRIRNPDQLVPGLEAEFRFEVTDEVDAFRVAFITIEWEARTVSAPGETRRVVEDERDRYSPGDDDAFEVEFDHPGTYEIHAFVYHNFYLPAHFSTQVVVTTEEAILESMREADAAQWGRELREGSHEFSDVFAGLVTDYEEGVRAVGELTETAAEAHETVFTDREARLRAELAQLDALLGQFAEESAQRDIVEYVEARRDRLQEALRDLSSVADDRRRVAHPVPVRGFFASRTSGIRSAPLELVAYFYSSVESGDRVYEGHLLDQTELYESQHYHFEEDGDSFEEMMEGLFVELTEEYPDGSISFSFQMYDGLRPTRRFVRYERVTDTFGKDIRGIVFSEAVGLGVNVLSAILTVFPPTAAVGIGIGIAYNAAATADELARDFQRGTLTTERTTMQLAGLGLDLVPVAGRVSRVVRVGSRAYKVVEAAETAGGVYLMTQEADREIRRIRDGQVAELARLEAQIQDIENVNASDARLVELRQRRQRLVESIRNAAARVFAELAENQALTMVGTSTAARLAGRARTGRLEGAEPGRPTTPEEADRPAEVDVGEPTRPTRREEAESEAEAETGPAPERRPDPVEREGEPAPRRERREDEPDVERRRPRETEPAEEGETRPRRRRREADPRREPERERRREREPRPEEQGRVAEREAAMAGGITRKTRDNDHTITVTPSGRIIRCSLFCQDLVLRYDHVLDAHPTLRNRADEIRERAHEAAYTGDIELAERVADDVLRFDADLRRAEEQMAIREGVSPEEYARRHETPTDPTQPRPPEAEARPETEAPAEAEPTRPRQERGGEREPESGEPWWRRELARLARRRELEAALPPDVEWTTLVWVNTRSGVIHTEDSRFYGRTTRGEYMLAGEALAQRNRFAGQGGGSAGSVSGVYDVRRGQDLGEPATVIKAWIGDPQRRANLERELPAAAEYAIEEIATYERAHSTAPGLGIEAGEAIRLAPRAVNRGLQWESRTPQQVAREGRGGIEGYLAEIQEALRPEDRLHLTTSTKTHSGTLRLKEIAYHVEISRDGGRLETLFRVVIEVDRDGSARAMLMPAGSDQVVRTEDVRD
jgi:hypothetical protein